MRHDPRRTLFLLGILALAASGPVPIARAQEAVNDILQRKDKALRQRRLDETLATLKDAGAGGGKKVAALRVLAGAWEVPFDRGPFLPAVKALLADDSEAVRAAALEAMPAAGAGPGDLPAMAALAKDATPAVRAAVVPALYGVKVPEVKRAEADGVILPAVAALLDDADTKVRIATLHALWGKAVTPEIEAQIIALSRETQAGGPGALGYDAIYYALSTRPVVRPAVADRLIELLRDGKLDPNVRWRAAWGLGHDASPEAVDRVVKALGDELDETLHPTIRNYAIEGLAHHRTPAALARLKKVAEADENPRLREAAAKAIRGK